MCRFQFFTWLRQLLLGKIERFPQRVFYHNHLCLSRCPSFCIFAYSHTQQACSIEKHTQNICSSFSLVGARKQRMHSRNLFHDLKKTTRTTTTTTTPVTFSSIFAQGNQDRHCNNLRQVPVFKYKPPTCRLSSRQQRKQPPNRHRIFYSCSWEKKKMVKKQRPTSTSFDD